MTVGRPTKFTPERCQAIINSVSDGMPYEISANENGIHRDTLTRWLRQGAFDLLSENDTEHSQFFCNIKKAVGKTMRDLLRVVRAGDVGWQGSAWILERRWWKHWSNKVADIDFNERLTALENEGKNKDVDNGKVESESTE